MKSGKKMSGALGYALMFGLFLGLCIWKFGNPVILDSKIPKPVSASDFLNDPWPTRWAKWVFLPFVIVGAVFAFKNKRKPLQKEHVRSARELKTSPEADKPATLQSWLWLLPLLWFGWQMFSATKTVDAGLTMATLWQFLGCVACYFIGVLVLGSEQMLRWLLIGVVAAFTFCVVSAVDQRLIEFPQNRLALIEGERAGWTNYTPERVLEMKRENIIISTNGVDVANPAILAKFAKGRVNGTLVYPNALAGAVLLLFPVSLVFAFSSAKSLRPVLCAIVIALTLFLGVAGFFWTGSKLGWLIAIMLGGACLFRLKWPAQLKWVSFIIVLLVGFGIFAVRFHNYFAAGATSAGARLDYWRAAAQTTLGHPLLGTGPGTFQRPYAQLKSPKSEMARLTHNDYLEQFSDSGIPGGIFYMTWILLALVVIGRRVWNSGSAMAFAIFAGLLGWFVQGIGEFSLYVPALAWTAFTLLGCLLGLPGNHIDKSAAAN